MNLYEGGELPVAHLDLYRIDDVEELEALGFRDLLDGVWIVFIEWPERVPDLADDVTWRVVFEERDIEERGITLHARRSQPLNGYGSVYRSRCGYRAVAVKSAVTSPIISETTSQPHTTPQSDNEPAHPAMFWRGRGPAL